MSAQLVGLDGAMVAATPEMVQQSLHDGDLLWLDLCQPDAAERAMLGEIFGIHPLAAEDADHFGQRPKIEDYDGFTQLVVFGAREAGEPMVEVHCFYAEHYLVTVRHDDCAAFAALAERLRRHQERHASRLVVLYQLLDSLVDSFFSVLSGFDDRIDDLQDQIFVKPTDDQLAELFTMKRWLVSVRKVITPQRDMLSSMIAGVTKLPGMTRDMERYFRDLYDHLIRISDMVDSYRDLLTGSMDAYLSIVSNRLNVVMKQLTVIATVFLPLTFLTGFFGQNFYWMIRRLTSLPAFLGWGIGAELVIVAGLVVLFRRRGWL